MAWGDPIDLKLGNGSDVFASVRENTVPLMTDGRISASGGFAVSANTTLAPQHLENVMDCSAALTLTIPTDAVLGISAATYRATMASLQLTAGAVAWAAGAGVTLSGTPKTAAQYVLQGVMRTGANAWAYVS